VQSALVLAAFAASCSVIAIIGARVTVPEIRGWYASLDKPHWTPPRVAFPIVWPVLYALIAIAGWRLWEAPSSSLRAAALTAYAIQLGLNAIWSPIFFGAHRLLTGLVVIVSLVFAIVATIALAWPIDRLAAAVLLPYLAWTSFAAALNASIWSRNSLRRQSTRPLDHP
jgi:tryptophan-rich sensory protein